VAVEVVLDGDVEQQPDVHVRDAVIHAPPLRAGAYETSLPEKAQLMARPRFRRLDGRGEVYPHMYPDGGFPPNTLLVVAGLVSEDYLVEIKAVAALP